MTIIERAAIFEAIVEERMRQEKLHPRKPLKTTQEPEVALLQNFFVQQEMLSILVEEVGEVGKAMQGDGNLKEELIQVASVCVRWLENMK